MSNLLKFARGNAKLGSDVYTFSLPAGHSCPFANECLSKADKKTGKLTDGPNSEFRCFSASTENMYPVVREARWHNFNLLKGKTLHQMVNLISDSIPKDAEKIRIHVSGDFFSQDYFDAWLGVSAAHHKKLFYCYTKSLNYWIKRMAVVGNGKENKYLNSNFIATASKGGKLDHLIEAYNLREARVVFSEEEAKELGLEIDHDDSHAMKAGPSFALLLHGVQPANTKASKSWSLLKKQGKNGYARRPLKIVGGNNE